MMILANINLFNLSSLLAFLIGIITGLALFIAFFGIMIARGKKKSKVIEGPTIDAITEDKIREMILAKQNVFTTEVEDNDADYFKTVSALSLELLHEISSYYYPNSKYPEYELTITEAGELIHYIVNQITSLFDRPVINNFKNVKISTIANLVDKTRKVTNNKTFKAVTGSGAGEAYSALKAVKNVINPIYWFRRIVLKGTMNIALKNVCKAGISIVGNETNKVYSKNLFTQENTDQAIKKDIEEVFSDEEEAK